MDLVVLDLDDHLGANAHRVAVVGYLERAEPLRHRRELGIREAFERLADLRETVAITHGQVVVRQPAGAPSGAPVGGDDHAVERPRRLELEPALAAAARLVRAGGVLRHDALVSRRERPLEKGAGRVRRADDHALREAEPAGDGGERLPALRVWPIDQRPSLDHEAVEEVERERHLSDEHLDAVHAPEATHQLLER